MTRPLPPEPVTIPGPAGRLEALVESPGEVRGDAAAVVCHPHPVFHGTMHNKVVHTMARAANRLGCPALRFNFRGVGDSEGGYGEGLGETEDALAAVAWARARWPGAAVWLAGFSFGAWVALNAARHARPALLVTIAPPVQRFPVAEVARPPVPWLVVQGREDEVVDPAAVEAWSRGLTPPPDLRLMDDTDHFFHGRLNPLREVLEDFLTRHG